MGVPCIGGVGFGVFDQDAFTRRPAVDSGGSGGSEAKVRGSLRLRWPQVLRGRRRSRLAQAWGRPAQPPGVPATIGAVGWAARAGVVGAHRERTWTERTGRGAVQPEARSGADLDSTVTPSASVVGVRSGADLDGPDCTRSRRRSRRCCGGRGNDPLWRRLGRRNGGRGWRNGVHSTATLASALLQRKAQHWLRATSQFRNWLGGAQLLSGVLG